MLSLPKHFSIGDKFSLVGTHSHQKTHGPWTIDHGLSPNKHQTKTPHKSCQKPEARSQKQKARGKKLQINYLKYFKNSNTQGYTGD